MRRFFFVLLNRDKSHKVLREIEMKFDFTNICGIFYLNNGGICVKLHKLIYGMTQ